MVRRSQRARVCRPYSTANRRPEGRPCSWNFVRFHRCLANLRVLAIEEIKAVPSAPVSRPFVERLIGRLRRESPDRVSFGSAAGLVRKLDEFKRYCNVARLQLGHAGVTPAELARYPPQRPLPWINTVGSSIAGVRFTSRSPLDDEFAMDTILNPRDLPVRRAAMANLMLARGIS